MSISSLMCCVPATLRLLRLPDLVQVRILALELRDLLLDQRKALLRRRVRFLLDRLALDLELDHAAVEPVHRLGLGIDLHPNPRGRFVDQVDRLVRQEAVGDVAMRELRRGDDRRVGDARRRGGSRSAPCRPRRMAIVDSTDGSSTSTFWKRRSSAASFSTYLRYSSSVVAPTQWSSPRASARLQHVAGVDRALGLARADHRMQLVDEDDRLAGIGGDVLQHGLQPLLEFAAVLGAGEERRHVERQHALALERFGHLAVDDALREALDDRRLAHARLADQHRVVLGAPLQDLDRPADLVVAADHRIELAVAGALGEVDRVFLAAPRAGPRLPASRRPRRRGRVSIAASAAPSG